MYSMQSEEERSRPKLTVGKTHALERIIKRTIERGRANEHSLSGQTVVSNVFEMLQTA